MYASCTASRAVRQPAVLGNSRAPVSASVSRKPAMKPLSPPAASVRFSPTVTTCVRAAMMASRSTCGDG